MPRAPALGIDLGGTGIKMGLIEPDGRIMRKVRLPTPQGVGPKEVTDVIVREARLLIQTLGKKPVLAGIGVGSAGDVEPGTGVIRISPNLKWHNVPLKKLLAKELRYPITVENDANVAAWAAYAVEAKRAVRNLLCVTLGTGVGGGIVIEGKLYRGSSGSAGEIGHMTLFPEGVPCNCGNFGCLERYVGARAMSDEARRAITGGEKTLIIELVEGDLQRIEPLIVQKAARANDRFALHLWELAGERLGIGLASLINVLNPEWIVLAGGLSRAGDLLSEPLRRTIQKRAFATPAATAKIVISKLDQDLGIVGAGLVAHEFCK
jgi:glucokinase